MRMVLESTQRVRSVGARWWSSRAGRRLLVEVSLLGAGFLAYKYVRLAVREQVLDAFANAEMVMRVERSLGIFTELQLQRFVMSSSDLMWWVNRYYVHMHFLATTVALIALYVVRPDRYLWLRRMLVAITAAGLVLHVAFPLAPPRMHWRTGFVDTLARWGPSVYADSAVAELANQYAAMPSLHVGYAVLIALAVIPVVSRPWKYLVAAHPAITTFAVVVTANHYWLDALVVVVMIVVADRLMFTPPVAESGPVTPRRLDNRPIDPLTVHL